jgi:hypothetical protein
MLDIALGLTDLSRPQVDQHRVALAGMGFDVPALRDAGPKPAVRQRRTARRSNIGTRLKNIISRAEPGAMTCGSCRNMVAELNSMTVAEVRKDIDRVVADIASRAPHQAPKLWQRIAVRIDQAIHLGQTEQRIQRGSEAAGTARSQCRCHDHKSDCMRRH